MNEKRAREIIKSLEETYDEIADGFDSTRSRLWVEFEAFRPFIRDGQHVLDLGCGNGRFAKLFTEWKIHYTGIDNSAKLLEKAQQSLHEKDFLSITLLKSSMDTLPFGDAAFDLTFVIASLHHIPPPMQHLVVQELFRVTQSGGKVCLTNWYLHGQDNRMKEQKRLRQESPELFHGMSSHDCFVPWHRHKDQTIHFRYYYAFEKNEVAELFASSGFSVIHNSISVSPTDTKRNIMTVAEKNR